MFTPFIQTHTFNVGCYLPSSQGYAPFLVSSSFNGLEKITFRSLDPGESGAPKISHRLNEYSSGKWYLSNEDRFRTATGGPLKPGRYQFVIQRDHDQPEEIIFRYDPYFIGCSNGIVFQRSTAGYRVEWVPPQEADSFWAFLLPTESKNFLEDLIPITRNQFTETSVALAPTQVSVGRYKCVVRTNRMWNHPAIAGFLSESWAISEQILDLP